MRGSRTDSRGLTEILQGYAKFLSDPSIALGTRIQMAAEVWRIQDLARTVLEPLKVALRLEARKRLKGSSGMVVIEGEGLTQAQVTIVPQVKVSPDLSVEEARRILGPEFDRLFRVTLNPRPDILTILDGLPARTQQAMARWVEVSEGTPRVSLQAVTGSGMEMKNSGSKG